MQIKPQITFQDVPPSVALEQEIMRRIDKLEQYCARLMRCDVVIRQVQRHKHQGKLFSTNVSVSVPGDKININHAANEDVYLAVRDAFNAVTRRLKSYSKRKRGQVKHHEASIQGRISKLHKEEGFGFIEADGNEYYFSSMTINNTEFERLREGMRVSFQEAPNGSQPQACHVNLLKNGVD